MPTTKDTDTTTTATAPSKTDAKVANLEAAVTKATADLETAKADAAAAKADAHAEALAKGKPCKFRLNRDHLIDGVIIRDDPSRIVDLEADGVLYINVRYDAADLAHIDPGTWSDKLT